MKKLWKWFLDWWDPPAVKVEIEGFLLKERKCLFCGSRYEILAAEIEPGRKRLRHGCRSCQSNGADNSLWIEI